MSECEGPHPKWKRITKKYHFQIQHLLSYLHFFLQHTKELLSWFTMWATSWRGWMSLPRWFPVCQTNQNSLSFTGSKKAGWYFVALLLTHHQNIQNIQNMHIDCPNSKYEFFFLLPSCWHCTPKQILQENIHSYLWVSIINYMQILKIFSIKLFLGIWNSVGTRWIQEVMITYCKRHSEQFSMWTEHTKQHTSKQKW